MYQRGRSLYLYVLADECSSIAPAMFGQQSQQIFIIVMSHCRSLYVYYCLFAQVVYEWLAAQRVYSVYVCLRCLTGGTANAREPEVQACLLYYFMPESMCIISKACHQVFCRTLLAISFCIMINVNMPHCSLFFQLALPVRVKRAYPDQRIRAQPSKVA